MEAAVTAGTVHFGHPDVADAAQMWQLVRALEHLDCNSPYFYLLWCRDFAESSVSARDDGGRLLGFVAGFRRPRALGTLFVWQIAVHPVHRRRGLGSQMLDRLIERGGAQTTALEASVMPGNAASLALFDSLARRRRGALRRRTLFEASCFPDHHDAEDLLRIDLTTPGDVHQ
ncbi:diaminobutyrate acetyltransferase [Streptomyces sp. Wh19]|uniref:diaminobutyrate acetyltransferase n=1 Tax=Streptomyces sp. Wh19 TaxID=3076629 RepID=UPI002958B59C|nr:diaminobutyrate acetyltransferase [Streptomyces sp. Wh19]MDV9199082.1 diaminobutyrate acetyltransferase [Streptomyces sp. Wh19]